MEHKFRKVVVIFIDILGSQSRSNFEEWYNIMSIFNKMVEREKALDETHTRVIYKREIHVFSDCAYIIYDYKDGIEESRKNMYELMGIACYNTEKVLYEFLKNEFIARGAITYGEMFYDTEKNIWFGPAMNRAYFLESKKASVPRVIIDPEYAEELYAFNEKKYRGDSILKMDNGEILLRDRDGSIYVNYLNTVKQGINRVESEWVIEKALELCNRERAIKRDSEELQQSIQKKYDWLERYLLQ